MSCRLDDITPPDCLLGCTNLTSIKLSGNFFSSFPAFLSSATSLQCLHLANNQIGSSGNTAGLATLTALTKLVMQQCGLHTVPDSFAALSNLQWLCLSRNSLSSIPDGLPWGKLTLLHLRGNELRAVPCAALAGSAQLQVVDCGDNPPLQVSLLLLGLMQVTARTDMYQRSCCHCMHPVLLSDSADTRHLPISRVFKQLSVAEFVVFEVLSACKPCHINCW